MTEDILLYFPKKSKSYRFGLFKTPIKSRQFYTTKINPFIHNIYGTFYGESKSMIIDEKENISLFDMFHGYCLFYGQYFVKQNPDWQLMELSRTTGYEKLNHVFAVKYLDDGRILFADARGITDDVIEFFSDFRISKDTMNVFPINIENEEYPISESIFETAYKMIFGTKFVIPNGVTV